MSIEWVQIGSHKLACGDCLDVLPTLAPGSVDAVVTSPPYGMQRADEYGGIPEADYPAWAVELFSRMRGALATDGSVLFNIRENIRDGEISDYVHKTRLAIRGDGWRECEELIWVKPCSPPFGSVSRPRRSWERVLWFSPTGRPYCDATANGVASDRVGIDQRTSKDCYNGGKVVTKLSEGIARCTDVISVRPDQTDYDHPAKYPVELAEWCARLVTRDESTILDPFMGSGTTGVACERLGRKFIGIEKERRYFDIAVRRIEEACKSQPLFAGMEA